MCLILFDIDTSKEFKLTLAANRDEYFDRPTSPMAFWEDAPQILAGRDLKALGTWFGVSRNGRFAALTNFRDLTQIKTNAPSRGEIIPRALEFKGPVPTFLVELHKKADQYSGFNLLTGEAKGPFFWYSNQDGKIFEIPPGVHGLSNHLLDTPWPKVARGMKNLNLIIEKENADKKAGPDEAFFDLLSDRTRPEDHLLPDTGVGLEWERILSPLFVSSSVYGTRSSTLMRIDANGTIRVRERTYPLVNTDLPEDREFIVTPGS